MAQHLALANPRSKKKLRKVTIAILVVIAGVCGAIVWQSKLADSPANNTPQKPAQKQPAATPRPLSYVDQTLSTMSLRDKVASLFMFHTPGTDPAVLTSYYNATKPGGLILMGDNISNTFEQLAAQTGALVVDKKLPPLIATDEEGDTVTRLSADTFPGALSLRNRPPEAAKTAFTDRSNLLKRGGINLNFGIIADVTDNPNSFIYPRVLGTTPQAAADRVVQAVAGSEGITLSTIKHFPGHGETSADSHTSVPSTAISYEAWQQRDAIPFQAGITAGADLVMFGHLRYTAVDDKPATLSPKWHDIVRNQLGFKGVIVTDDMIMLQNSGDAAYADPVANAVAAVQAGNDLLLYVLNHGGVSNQVDPNALIDGVVAAVQNGAVPETAINQHAKNVLNIRNSIGTAWYGQ